MSDTLKKPRVGFFVTCLVDIMRPRVGFAAVKLLEQAGCEVEVPRSQSCCGQPAYNNGDEANSRAIAKQVINVFDQFDYIVVPSGSCAGMFSEHFPRLFRYESSWLYRSQRMAARTWELTRFLVEVMQGNSLGSCYPATCAYHDSCSGLRELGIQEQPRQLLSLVKDLSLAELDERDVCCGFGGTFSVKYPEISTRLVSNKVSDLEQTAADTLLGGDLGCLLNIAGRLRREGAPVRVFHVAEVLAGMTDGPAIGEGESDS
jgi:L-lactate dehydrogenase complex protein LldE